jgi:hypothetical protein
MHVRSLQSLQRISNEPPVSGTQMTNKRREILFTNPSIAKTLATVKSTVKRRLSHHHDQERYIPTCKKTQQNVVQFQQSKNLAQRGDSFMSLT